MTSNLITTWSSTCSDEKVRLLTLKTQGIQDLTESGRTNVSNITLYLHLSASRKFAIFVMYEWPGVFPQIQFIRII